jgi:hypothetical protein
LKIFCMIHRASRRTVSLSYSRRWDRPLSHPRNQLQFQIHSANSCLGTVVQYESH